MTGLELAAATALVWAWAPAGAVTWMLLYVLLPGMAWDRIRARYGRKDHDAGT